MAADSDDNSRHGQDRSRALITAVAVVLAGCALGAIALTDTPGKLKLAVVAALWAFVLVAITGRFKSAEASSSEDSDDELRRFYQMELQQEVAARREYELRLEVQLRRELEEARSSEVSQLRGEILRLRNELVGMETSQDKVRLLAAAGVSANGRSAEDVRGRTGTHRPPGPLELPARFDPPATPAASIGPDSASASFPPYPAPVTPVNGSAEKSDEHVFTPTEFLPPPPRDGSAGSAGSAPFTTYSTYSSRTVSADSGPHQSGPHPTDQRPPAVPFPTDQRPAAAQYPPDPYEQADRASSASWSSYVSPNGSAPNGTPAEQVPPTQYPATTYGEPTSDRARHETVEPRSEMSGRGRHGVLPPDSQAEMSSTWPGAFKPARPGFDDPQPFDGPQPENGRGNHHEPEQQFGGYGQPAGYQVAEAHGAHAAAPSPEPSRGRHHAADDDEAAAKPNQAPPPAGQTDEDVLAQILGRW